jgi:hypothetical protein
MDGRQDVAGPSALVVYFSSAPVFRGAMIEDHGKLVSQAMSKFFNRRDGLLAALLMSLCCQRGGGRSMAWGS